MWCRKRPFKGPIPTFYYSCLNLFHQICTKIVFWWEKKDVPVSTNHVTIQTSLVRFYKEGKKVWYGAFKLRYYHNNVGKKNKINVACRYNVHLLRNAESVQHFIERISFSWWQFDHKTSKKCCMQCLPLMVNHKDHNFSQNIMSS